ncbi:MAG: hypothetical protein JWO71_136 [Candidatus Acidoferrum typicum]|nr:hypothetical protein [Candidatus Acidoferrum typicum]
MRRMSPNLLRKSLNAGLAVTVSVALLPSGSYAWGGNGQRVVVNQAIDTLPADLRAYFESQRSFVVQHVTDPLDAEAKTPTERHNHFIRLDKYGHFPFDALPRSYKAAVNKFGKSKIDASGLLPWEIGVYSAKLTEAMKLGHWDEARLNAAILAFYVAEAHDPFNTTENFDGHLTDQRGINERFGTTLIDRFSSFFPMRPNDGSFITDPTDHAFEACLSAHSWLEVIELADRNARRESKSYNDEFFDRFYNQSAGTLIRQLSDAATDVGSYWLTAWTNAGKPALPH